MTLRTSSEIRVSGADESAVVRLMLSWDWTEKASPGVEAVA